MPSRFARQFGYDQLYVDNPNPHLGHTGSLIDNARALRYFIAGYTGAPFCMPLRVFNLLISLRFCQWYHISNSCVPEFRINAFKLKLIVALLIGKVDNRKKGKWVRVAGLHEFEATSEAS